MLGARSARPGRAPKEPLLVVEVSDRQCAIRVAHVREIVPLAALSRPLGMPAILDGYLTIGSDVLPVIHMARYWGAPELAIDLYTSLVLVRSAGRSVAMLVDRVCGLAEGEPADATPKSKERLAISAINVGGRVVGLVDADALIDLVEREVSPAAMVQAKVRIPTIPAETRA